MVFLNYPKLIAVTGLSQQQLKRIVLELYGTDATASGGRGVVREFSLNDGFYINLAGMLTVDHGMKISETRRVVFDLVNVLTDLQRELQTWLLPERIWGVRAEKPFPRIVLRIHVAGLIEVRIYDAEPDIKFLQEEEKVARPDLGEFVVKKNRERLNEGPCTVLFYPEGKGSLKDRPKRLLCELELRDMISDFVFAVKSLA